MVRLAVILLVLALLMSVIGFGGFFVGTFVDVAKLLILVFLVLAVVSFVFGRGSVDSGL